MKSRKLFVSDNTMITKSLKNTRTQRKIWIFPLELHEKSPFAHCNTLSDIVKVDVL